MNKKSLMIIVIQSFVIILLIWVVILMGSDEFVDDDLFDEDETLSFIEVNDKGLNQIRLTEAIVKNSGIQTTKIISSNKQSSFSNYGIVQATDTLIDLKNIYDQLMQEINTLQNQINTEEKKYLAFVDLNADGKNISDQALLDQQTLVNNLRVSVEKKVVLKKNLQQKVLSQWGNKFYMAITGKAKDKQLNPLLNGEARLVKITLPSSDSDNSIPHKIIFTPINGNKETEGIYLDKASTIEPSILGQTFYYLIQSPDIRIGSKLIGFYKEKQNNDKQMNRYEVQSSSIVWSNGLPWVYIEEEPFLFVKKPVSLENEIKDGWLVISEALSTNDIIVSKGAQLLLSEEYKYQIKNENED